MKAPVQQCAGKRLTLALDADAGWDVRQMTGTFTDGGRGATALPVQAQRNAFGKTWFFRATGDEKNGWTFAFAESAKTADVTVTLNADGKTTIAGTLGSHKVSASGYADVSGLSAGAILADFAPVITVNKVKKTLSMQLNLWFDRKDDHEDGIGSAQFVD